MVNSTNFGHGPWTIPAEATAQKKSPPGMQNPIFFLTDADKIAELRLTTKRGKIVLCTLSYAKLLRYGEEVHFYHLRASEGPGQVHEGYDHTPVRKDVRKPTLGTVLHMAETLFKRVILDEQIAIEATPPIRMQMIEPGEEPPPIRLKQPGEE